MIFRKVDDLRETFVKDTQRLRDLLFLDSQWITEELLKISLTKCSLINELRHFCKRWFFVRLKISTVSTFGKNGQPEKVVYRGATKEFI